MAGWDLKYGSIKEFYINDDRIWSLFNYVFSDSCRKRNTYNLRSRKIIPMIRYITRSQPIL